MRRRQLVGQLGAAISIVGIAGCTSSGLSPREHAGNTQVGYLNALYAQSGASTSESQKPAAAAFTGPASVAVAQVGEVSPSPQVLERFRKDPTVFARVESVPAVSNMEGVSYRRNDGSSDADIARRHIDGLRAMARDMHMDYLMLIGGTVDSETNSTPLSILNLTIIGAFVIPSDQTRALVKASGAMIDVRSGRVVSVSSAEVEGGHLTPAASTEGENTQLYKRLRNEVSAKLASQIVADCKVAQSQASPTTAPAVY